MLFFLIVSCLWCEAQSNALSERKWEPLMKKTMEWVTEKYNNGYYKGQRSDNQRSGLGVYYWLSGTWHWGKWSNGDREGMSIYIVPEGYEVFNCSGCVYYVGKWDANGKSGKGSCYDKYGNLLYYGDFSNDRPTDVYPVTGGYSQYKFECFEYTNGGMYIGETNNGENEGCGIYLWAEGNAWYGQWKEGKRAGYGIYLTFKGQVNVGNWQGNNYTPEVVREYANRLTTYQQNYQTSSYGASGNYSSGSSSTGRGAAYYQNLYRMWERRAEANYRTLTNVGVSFKNKNTGERTGSTMQGYSSANYVSMKKNLREAQREMQKYRRQAAQEGITIPQSTWETVTVSY